METPIETMTIRTWRLHEDSHDGAFGLAFTELLGVTKASSTRCARAKRVLRMALRSRGTPTPPRGSRKAVRLHAQAHRRSSEGAPKLRIRHARRLRRFLSPKRSRPVTPAVCRKKPVSRAPVFFLRAALRNLLPASANRRPSVDPRRSTRTRDPAYARSFLAARLAAADELPFSEHLASLNPPSQCPATSPSERSAEA